ncbi:S1 RNA-binding domain-containing protein [Streptomyces sp. NPDC047880]|uniref:S1 RNA-binding domain-containing protein n=1 Tax=Streptomyces sp. NPDC047880 TaxID=3155626 RepID=UPI0034516B0C
MWPDPFGAFADSTTTGRELRGHVTKLVPSGVFVEVADGIEGPLQLRDLARPPVADPPEAVKAGDELTVVVTGTDRRRRTPSLCPATRVTPADRNGSDGRPTVLRPARLPWAGDHAAAMGRAHRSRALQPVVPGPA